MQQKIAVRVDILVAQRSRDSKGAAIYQGAGRRRGQGCDVAYVTAY